MPRVHNRTCGLAVCVLLAMGATVSGECVPEWLPGSGLPGVNGTVYASAVYDDGSGSALYVGGSFTLAGTSTVSNIAKWNGTSWSGIGSGTNGTVRALAVFNGSLVAGGDFTTAGGATVNHIAKWNGSAWSVLGGGISDGSSVYALVVWNSNLYAGGDFSIGDPWAPPGDPHELCRGVARWDGSTWYSMASGLDGGWGYSLTVWNSSLVVGGWFSSAGGVTANNIARWNGTSWAAIGTGTGSSSQIYALGVYNSNLIAGGSFTTIDGVSASNIAQWNGSAWSPLGSGLGSLSSRVYTLATYGSKLVVGGDFFSYSYPSSGNYITQWNGTAWSSLGSVPVGTYPGMDLTVRTLTLYSGNLVAAGDFTAANGLSLSRVGLWNGTSWFAASGLNNSVQALLVSGTDIIVGGLFTTAGGLTVNRVAKWNGTDWSTMGSGMDGPVYALAIYSGDLIAAGSFTNVGSRIARWNGTSWSPLGSGMNNEVRSLTVYNGRLIAGGNFTTAGGLAANRVAQWNGSSWSAVGSGFTYPNSYVYALAEYSGNLIAGGSFSGRISKWDGTSWSTVGTGVNNTVYALALYNNNLVAGGSFYTAGGNPASYIAQWDGTSWSTFGSGTGNTVYALAAYNNGLIAGGAFTTAGGTSANRIAQWNGTTWSALGTGVNNTVQALAIINGDLLAGGLFSTAGGNNSPYWARASVHPPAIAVQPVSQSACVGVPVSFQVSATGTNLTYQWRRDGVDIPDAIADTYTIPSVTTQDAANAPGYLCVVTGGCGAPVTSTPATLTVLTVPTIDFQPTNQISMIGAPLAFTIATSGSGLTYQWMKDGVNIEGATAATYTIPSAVAGDAANNPGYQCVVSGCGVQITSNAATAIIQTPPTITQQPTRQSVCAGNLATFTVHATPNGTPSPSYQWQISQDDGRTWTPVEGSASETYSLRVGSSYDHNQYRCAISITGGSIYSNAADLFVTRSSPLPQPDAGGVPSCPASQVGGLVQWDGNSWGAFERGAQDNVNGPVWALAVYNNHLIVGGQFTRAGGVPVNNIAQWDGTSWSALGDGIIAADIYPPVEAMLVYNNRLIVGGSFTQAGGAMASNIAQWDGSTWSRLGDLQEIGMVGALGVYQGNLIAGGRFIAMDGYVANLVARWDGAHWVSMGFGNANNALVPLGVAAITVYDNMLFIGGGLDVRLEGPVFTVAQYDGSSWSTAANLYDGYGGFVHSLQVYNGDLFAGGEFWYSIQKWSTTHGWEPFGYGLSLARNDFATALTVYENVLIAAGYFTPLGADTYGRRAMIVQWNGSSWSVMNNGLSMAPVAFVAFNGRLIAGGADIITNTLAACACWKHQSVLHVDSRATTAGNGCSWLEPIGDLQVALGLAANTALDIDEIWVAEGTYFPTQPASSLPGEARCATFNLLNNVAIYGGFSGNETSRDQRDPVAHPTILTNKCANSRTVVVASGVDSTAVLDGFTIEADQDAPEETVNEFFIDGSPTLSNNIIKTRGSHYLDVIPDASANVNPVLVNNSILVTVRLNNEGICGATGTMLPLYEQDYDCSTNCGSGPIPGYDSSPGFLTSTAIHSLDIREGAIADLFTPQTSNGGPLAMYARNLSVAGTLNTGLQRLYYQQGSPPEFKDVPLLGFSLVNIDMNCPTEFNARVRTSAGDAPAQGSISLIHDDRYPEDQNAQVMQMSTQAAGMQAIASVAAKGAFARTTEDNITVLFEYKFVKDDNAEIVVSLSDNPDIGSRSFEVARVRMPVSGRPGSRGDTDPEFGVFYGTFPRVTADYTLNFTRGTYVELTLVASHEDQQAIVWIDNFDPQISCTTCADLNGSNTVEEADYEVLLAQYGQPLAPVDPNKCLDHVFSGDHYVDMVDMLGWDALLDPVNPPTTACGTTLPVKNMLTQAQSTQSGSILESSGTTGPSLLIAGKRNGSDQADLLYSIGLSGACAGTQAPFGGNSTRSNGRLIQNKEGTIYQLHGTWGLLRQGTEPVTQRQIVPPQIFDNWNGTGKSVYVGISHPSSSWVGVPMLDAAFSRTDNGVLYVVPVVVDPHNGGCPYRAAAKLQLGTSGDYSVTTLYGADPGLTKSKGCDVILNPDRQHLREIEVDAAGNVYVLTAHALNNSDAMLIYSDGGTLATELPLHSIVPDPSNLLITSAGDQMFMISSAENLPSGQANIYRFDLQGNLTATIPVPFPTCGDMGYGYETSITSLAEGDGSLYAVGFAMAKYKADQDPNKPTPIRPVAKPAMGVVSLSNPSQSWVQEITGCSGASLGLPVSAVYVPGSPNPSNGAANPSPGDGAINVSTTVALNWTAGLGSTSHDVYFGTSSPGAPMGNQPGTRYNPGTQLDPNTTYYWRVDEHSASGTVAGRVWSFTTATAGGQASAPYPANGATGVDVTAKLNWGVACGTTSHNVYFGTSNPPPAKGNQAGTVFDPGSLAPQTLYYWRIDELSGSTVTPGRVWTFRTKATADFNNDGKVDAADLAIFIQCATGPAIPYNPAALPNGCSPMPMSGGIIAAESDGDGDVDADDFAAFQRAWSP